MQKDWFDIIIALANLAILAVLAWLAYRQWNSSEKTRTGKYYLDSLLLLDKAKQLVIWGPGISSEARDCYNESSNIARLMLPQEIQEYTEKMLVMANHAFILEQRFTNEIYYDGRSNDVDEYTGLKSQLLRQEHYKIFQKFLK